MNSLLPEILRFTIDRTFYKYDILTLTWYIVGMLYDKWDISYLWKLAAGSAFSCGAIKEYDSYEWLG